MEQLNCKSVTICVARFNPFTIFSGYNLTNCKHCETYDTSENSKICENIGKSEPSETSEPEKIVKGVNLVKSKTSELVLRNQTKWDKPELCSGSQKS